MNAARAFRAGGTADSSTGPIVQLPSLDVLGLRALEVVERPEDRQPAVGVGRGEAGQVRRVDHQDRVELVADAGPRLDVAHARPATARRAPRDRSGPSGSARRPLHAAGSRGVSSSSRTRGSISGWRRTTFGSRDASSAETGRSRDRKPRSPRPKQRTARRGRLEEAPTIRSHAHGCSCSQGFSCGRKWGYFLSRAAGGGGVQRIRPGNRSRIVNS